MLDVQMSRIVSLAPKPVVTHKGVAVVDMAIARAHVQIPLYAC